jgi:RNA polymerase sigma-70 factor (ECF subfamily)
LEREEEKLKPIITASIKGNASAQRQLYNLYVKAMYHTALRITSSSSDAEDVLQEAFINAFNNLNNFSYQSTFGAWLKRIVVNKSIDFINKKKLTLVSDISEFELPDNEEYDEEPDYSVEEIKEAMQKLANGYRLTLSLYLFEGYDHAEISEILGISESTSKSQYHRAKKQLLKMIQHAN